MEGGTVILVGMGVILTLVGLALIVGMLAFVFQSMLFRIRAVRCNGRVVEVQQERNKFLPLIEYMTVHGLQKFRPQFWSVHRWNTGDEVAIAYDPANPARARLLEGLSNSIIAGAIYLFTSGALALGLGLAVFIVGIRRPAEQREEDVTAQFIAAAGQGDINTVRRMLASRPNLVNAGTGSRRIVNRPLYAAAKGLHPDIVALLLDRGASADAAVQGATALHATGENLTFDDTEASAKRVKIINLLLDRGANVNARSKAQTTPLFENAGDPKAVELLLAHGADVNVRDDRGRTPILRAATAWDSHAVQLLLDHGADIRARDREGNTALLMASMSGNLPVLELLLSRGAPAKVASDAGATPLHMFAAHAGVPGLDGLDALALLCSLGLRPDVRDHEGKTPLDVARNRLPQQNESSLRKGQNLVQFLSPGGPCDRFARNAPPVSEEERKFIVAGIACTQIGDTDGCARLAWSYDTGTGVQVNKQRAAELYKPACDTGKTWTCFNLARLYANGDGVPKNRAMATTLYRKACEGGDTDACEKLRSRDSRNQ